MAPEVSATMGLMRLADQVQSLSALTEALTYRLLELEEKVAALDLTLQPLMQQSLCQGDATAQLAADTELRLDETEERLARLEVLLSGIETVAVADDRVETEVEPEVEPEQLFLDDDGEQPFLDDSDEEGYDERLSA
jgi:hypothetical protein